jgi:hypothetical protein
MESTMGDVRPILSEQSAKGKKFKIDNSEYTITSSEKSGDEFYKIQYSKVMPNGMIEKKSNIGYVGKKYPKDIQSQPIYKSPIAKSTISIWDLLTSTERVPGVLPEPQPMTKQQEAEYINKFAKMISDDMQIGKKSMYSKKLNLEIKFKFNGDFLIIGGIKIPMKDKQVTGFKGNKINFKDEVDLNLDFKVHPTFDEDGAKRAVSEILRAKKYLDDFNSKQVGKEIDYKGIGVTKGNKPILSPDTPYDGVEVKF